MARTRTLSELRTEARQKADVESATSWLDNAELNRYINESIANLYDVLIEAHDQEWYLIERQFTTSSDTSTYNLDSLEPVGGGTPAASNMYILKGVDIVRNGDRFPLAPYVLLDRHDRDNVVRGSGIPRRYRLLGEADTSGTVGTYTPKIRLQPTPDSAHDIVIMYIPHAPELSSDTDVWDGFNGWEEYVVTDAAIKILEKDERDPSALYARLRTMDRRIRTIASGRDWSRPGRVTDVYRDYGGPLVGEV